MELYKSVIGLTENHDRSPNSGSTMPAELILVSPIDASFRHSENGEDGGEEGKGGRVRR